MYLLFWTHLLDTCTILYPRLHIFSLTCRAICLIRPHSTPCCLEYGLACTFILFIKPLVFYRNVVAWGEETPLRLFSLRTPSPLPQPFSPVEYATTEPEPTRLHTCIQIWLQGRPLSWFQRDQSSQSPSCSSQSPDTASPIWNQVPHAIPYPHSSSESSPIQVDNGRMAVQDSKVSHWIRRPLHSKHPLL